MRLFLLLLGYVTSSGDLQPSTAIANQLLGKSVLTIYMTTFTRQK